MLAATALREQLAALGLDTVTWLPVFDAALRQRTYLLHAGAMLTRFGQSGRATHTRSASSTPALTLWAANLSCAYLHRCVDSQPALMVRCRHGKQSLGGLVTDGASSVERYVRGHFLDDTRQVCLSRVLLRVFLNVRYGW
jgi:hypothetical protein